ncbi:FMN-binding negative transcriptional regulator [Stappia sp. F7233]|uniref:FMN-binding negative transcriptional regulator n=1 Tax=Stappia albiluteola TaxID=2758565 RepID=A0A839AFL2_9HYPH|nr:FMN-binding negative transcriptional regulator [Stappia albiluteola]MBA5777818.1 FMN-binding negative transcriptional regulator [Stappia albiluteola]
MYSRDASREERPEVLKAAIRDLHFASLVTAADGGILCTHLPMILMEDEDGTLRLEGHVARANPHWRTLSAAPASLAIFQGPHAYVSPSWYATKAETGKAVPTWTYVSVHAHGRLRVMENTARLLAHLERLTRRNEDGRADPWLIKDAPDGFVEALSRGIVGVELAVERLDGVWKLNQHRSGDDRAGMVAGLREEGKAGATRIAELAAGLDVPLAD